MMYRGFIFFIFVAAVFLMSACDAGSDSKEPPSLYKITVSETTGGTVEPSAVQAEKGETVSLELTPDVGYELKKLIIRNAAGETILSLEM